MRMDTTEKELVTMVLAGRTDAFEPLVTPYRRRLLALAYSMSQDWEEAKEIAQDALLRAFRSLGSFDTNRSFRSWLFQIAVNIARDRARKKRREAVMIEDAKREPQPTVDPERPLASSEFRSGLMKCLDQLSPRERKVFLLRDIEELDIKETARALGSSSISVRVHLSSARRKIRDFIRDRFPHLEDG